MTFISDNILLEFYYYTISYHTYYKSVPCFCADSYFRVEQGSTVRFKLIQYYTAL